MSHQEAQQLTIKKGRMSVSVLTNLRLTQWANQLSDSSTATESQPVDDEITLKLKMCLLLESQLVAIEMGTSL
jgi:hypothetical protein